MVKLIVKKAEYYNKKNERYDCLDCSLKFETTSIDWKDFKQKIIEDLDLEINKDNLVYVENRGYNVNGFLLPWNVQFALKQALEKELIK